MTDNWHFFAEYLSIYLFIYLFILENEVSVVFNQIFFSEFQYLKNR